MIHHVALRFAYDGHAFPEGYARQPGNQTVEDAIIKAAKQEGFIPDSWRTGSRTDKGVSALENISACAFNRPHLQGLIPALQSHCPPGVWITGVAPVPEGWNPRYHALRTYHYLAPQNGEELTLMQETARLFEGEHNMAGFARVDGGRNPIRQISSCRVSPDGEGWMFEISSPGFLWNQVRRMVDAIIRVGDGKLPLTAVRDSLATGKIHPAMKLAPAAGLLLGRVEYTTPLEWLPEAGTINPADLQQSWQTAQVHSRLIDRLTEL